MSPDTEQRITAFFSPRKIDKGTFLGKRGLFCHRLGFVQEGYVRVFVETPDREVTQWITTPGYFITDLTSFLFQVPGRWHMQALTDCTLLEITREKYDLLTESVPAWRELDRIFIARCFGMLEDRIFQHLHMSSEERFHQLMNTQPQLFQHVPLQYLASMLGMTPETLSRLRKKATRGQGPFHS